jgi:hypothetical protein
MTLDQHWNAELQAHYTRNADATGHAATCRCRVVPRLGADHKVFDPERCERCQFLVGRFRSR